MRRYHSEIFQKTGCTRACFFIGSLGAVVTCAASYLTYTSLHESLEYHSSISIVNTIQSGCDAIGNVIYDLNRYSSSNANKDLGATTSSFSFDPLVYGSFAGNKLEAHSSSLKLRSSQRKYLTSVLQSLDNKKSGESSYKNKPRSSEDHRCLFSNRRLEISELALSYLIHQIPKNVSGLPKDSILISTRNHGRLFFTLFDPVSLLGFDKKRATYINKIEKFKPFSIEPSYFFSVRNTNILKDSSFLAQSGDAKVEPELKFFSEVIFDFYCFFHFFSDKFLHPTFSFLTLSRSINISRYFTSRVHFSHSPSMFTITSFNALPPRTSAGTSRNRSW